MESSVFNIQVDVAETLPYSHGSDESNASSTISVGNFVGSMRMSQLNGCYVIWNLLLPIYCAMPTNLIYLSREHTIGNAVILYDL